MLLFHGGSERYALDCRYILTIVPMVELTKQRQAPPYIAGLMRYHQKLVPVIDLCQLLQGKPAANHLSTRIILVEYPLQEERHILGLVAERVTETVKMNSSAFEQGDLSMDGTGIIQQVRLDRLVSKLNTQFILAGDASSYWIAFKTKDWLRC